MLENEATINMTTAMYIEEAYKTPFVYETWMKHTFNSRFVIIVMGYIFFLLVTMAIKAFCGLHRWLSASVSPCRAIAQQHLKCYDQNNMMMMVGRT